MNPILKIENFSLKYASDFFAVENADIAVGEGQWISVVGRSGSGKSSLALSPLRLSAARDVRGQALYFKEGNACDLLSLDAAALRMIRGREIAMIFQDPGSSLNPVLRVGDQIAEAYLTHFSVTRDQAAQRAMQFLSKVKLKDPARVFNSYPHQLSGGMKQRAMIAMALISGPRLLIADEPTTALDAATETEILTLLSELKKSENLSLLFITHNLALACERSNGIYVMDKGHVVEHLTPENRFEGKHAATRRLFAANFVGLKRKEEIPV